MYVKSRRSRRSPRRRLLTDYQSDFEHSDAAPASSNSSNLSPYYGSGPALNIAGVVQQKTLDSTAYSDSENETDQATSNTSKEFPTEEGAIEEKQKDESLAQKKEEESESQHAVTAQKKKSFEVARTTDESQREVQEAIDNPDAGEPLRPDIQQMMENKTGRDYDDVRVHSDGTAHEANRALNAKAFAHGSDIWLGRGQSQDDEKLMAHELTHVAQQGATSDKGTRAQTKLQKQSNTATIQRSPLSDELSDIWLSGDTNAFFQRLRNISVSDPDVRDWVVSNLSGDERWMAINILDHGPKESSWPIHLRVDRQMLYWPGSRGKSGVFDLLRKADRAYAFDPELSDTLWGYFFDQPDDWWLAENLQTYGAEDYWPIDLRVERAMKGWRDSGGKAKVFNILRDDRRAHKDDNFLKNTLSRVFAGKPDDLWLSEKLQKYGKEKEWPVHFRVDREMKGWADCYGEKGVYKILKEVDGNEAGNPDLETSLNRVFSGKPDERMYAKHLQEYGDVELHENTMLPDASMVAGLNQQMFPGATSATGATLQWDGGSLSTLTAAQKTAARNDLKRRVRNALRLHLRKAMRSINKVRRLPRIPIGEFQGAGEAAKQAVDAKYAAYATAAAPTTAQPTGQTEFQMRTAGPAQTLFDAYDTAQRSRAGAAVDAGSTAWWIATNDKLSKKAQKKHNFNPNRPGSNEEEDFLWNDVVVPFYSDPTTEAKLKLYDLYMFGQATERGIIIPTSVAAGQSRRAGPGGSPSKAIRAAKWDAWKLTVHEYLHMLEHSAFGKAAQDNPILIEGFCEMFTKEVLTEAIPRAPGDPSLITKIEGGIYQPKTNAHLIGRYQTASDYKDNLKHAENIRDTVIGPGRGGDVAVKAAFFQGHVEYIGLTPEGTIIAATPNVDLVSVPAGVSNITELAVASGLSEMEIETDNPGLTATASLPGQVYLSGCRDHLVVESLKGIELATPLPTKAQLAVNNGITISELERVNSGVDWNNLYEGQTIYIPQNSESKGRIAAQHGITPLELERANPGVNWDALKAGQRLLIPKH